MHIPRSTRRTRGVAGVVTALAVSLALAACGSSGNSGSSGSSTINIGANLPLTGAVSGQAEQVLAGYKLGIADINAKGGINGHKLNLVVKDDRFDPSTASNVVKQMIVQNHVSALLGTFGSDGAIASSAVAEQYKVPVIQVFVSDPQITGRGYKYTFNLFPLASQIEPVADDFIANQLKATSVGIVYLNLGWAQAGEKTSNDELTKAGIKVTAEQVPTGQSDYTAALSKIRAANPDAIKLIAYDGDVATCLQEIRQLGIKPKMVYIEGDPTVDPAVTSALGQNMLGVSGTPNWYPNSQTFPAADALATQYTQSSGKPASTELIKGYQATQVLADALKRANSTDAGKIRDALASGASIDTVLGAVKFEANGQADQQFVLSQYQTGLKVVPIWPAAVKLGDYVPYGQ